MKKLMFAVPALAVALAAPALADPPQAPSGKYVVTQADKKPTEYQLNPGAPGTFDIVGIENDRTWHMVWENGQWVGHRAPNSYTIKCEIGPWTPNPAQDLELRPEGNKLVGILRYNWSLQFPGCVDPATGQTDPNPNPAPDVEQVTYTPA
jgi:hypothetical protein